MEDKTPEKKDNFLAEVEVMDMLPLKQGQHYLVAVSKGGLDEVKFLCSTVHGPYNFTEMVQEVGDMWSQHQHHSKVVILSKNPSEKVAILDENTIDYIECHYVDIITEEMLGGAFDSDEKKFTCVAGTSLEENSTDPRHEPKKAEDASEQDTSP